MAGSPVRPVSMTPAGHYSPGYRVGGWVFVSGQLPVRSGAAPDAKLSFEQQVRIVLENVRAVVEAAGGSLADVVKVTVYVTDIALWGEFNRLYAEAFGSHRPARVVVPVPELHHGLKLEVEALAYVAD